MNERRPNPETLLEALQRQEGGSGKLRIFLGMCPGVGKTYSMLKAAAAAKQRGTRVLVGVVETHGRKETEALLDGLVLLPRKKIEYRGTFLSEMDLDAILRERPSLVLVDELAHTNAPGSRHLKRYQDVEEILRAGIDVYTTLNIQHIESRNDQVAQITGVHVKETVPDSVIESADQLELVDLSPEELLRRLQEGKVYLGERAEAAIKNFFREEHLSALRELALRLTAEKVDQDLHDQMIIKGIEGPWNTNERLLVAVSHSPYSARLIRATRRMAYNLEAPWVALYVNIGQALSPEDEKVLQENLALARKLGAEVITAAGPDIVSTMQRVCSEKNVTQIVMGRPDKRFRDFFSRGTLLDQLVRTTSNIDVHVIRAERKPRFTKWNFRLPVSRSTWQAYYNTFWLLSAVSFFCYGALPYLGYRALGSVFLLCILLVSAFAGRGPILFSAVLSAVVWNFVFIPPVFTFAISASEDLMMVFSFFVTAIVGGMLTSRIRRQEAILQNREQRTRLLYELSQRLVEAKSAEDIKETLASVVDRQFGGRCTVFLIEKGGRIDWQAGFGKKMEEKEIAVAQWAFENDQPAGWSTQTLSAASSLCLPMRGRAGAVGILSFVPTRSQKDFSVEKENFLEAVLSQAAIAYERFHFAEAAENARVYEASEVLHQTLLNSVSHELRTPITALIGSATALRDPATSADPAAREALSTELVRSAHRLDRVVENLLDLSRIQNTGLQLKKEWFDLADLLTEARGALIDEIGNRRLELVTDENVVVEGDFRLLSHALNQLVLNAAKYSPDSSRIEVDFLKDNVSARIVVRDEGRGIPEGEEKKIFDRFYRMPGSPAGGLGLGLAIVSGIAQLHGGRVSARSRREGSGAVFEISLPLKPVPAALREAME